jgi:hypothetical protein
MKSRSTSHGILTGIGKIAVMSRCYYIGVHVYAPMDSHRQPCSNA